MCGREPVVGHVKGAAEYAAAGGPHPIPQLSVQRGAAAQLPDVGDGAGGPPRLHQRQEREGPRDCLQPDY